MWHKRSGRRPRHADPLIHRPGKATVTHMKSSLVVLGAVIFLAGCVSDSGNPQYSLTGGEQGVFKSSNPGRAIPVSTIKGMDENQLKATFGTPALDRKDGPMRALRYQSDGCSLWVYVSA